MTLDKLKNLDKEDILHLLGLESRRTTMDALYPSLGFLGLGMLVGAGLGLLFAPRTGRELRHDLSKRIQDVPEAVSHLPQRAADAFQRASDNFSDQVDENMDDNVDHRQT